MSIQNTSCFFLRICQIMLLINSWNGKDFFILCLLAHSESLRIGKGKVCYTHWITNEANFINVHFACKLCTTYFKGLLDNTEFLSNRTFHN